MIKKRLVYNVFYSLDGNTKAPNIHSTALSAYDIYMRNSFVSLYSAKKSDPEVDAVLFVNCCVRSDYKDLFDQNGIRIEIVEFDSYVMPENFKWGYAFYKLCVLKYIANNMLYEQIIGLDTDTVVIDDLSNLWTEAENTNCVYLYNLHRNLGHSVMKSINNDYSRIYNENSYISQWGGGVCLRESNSYT